MHIEREAGFSPQWVAVEMPSTAPLHCPLPSVDRPVLQLTSLKCAPEELKTATVRDINAGSSRPHLPPSSYVKRSLNKWL